MTLVGSTIGHIRLESILGAGGMGEVYRGLDETLQRRVAVKTIRAEHRLSPDAKARFLREARILSKLAHPAICQVYDLIETEEADFLVLEFVEGSTLDDLQRDRRLEAREVLELGVRITEALAVAHRERVVHRDLKPANIMVTPSGAVKVLDFGLARSVAESTEATAAAATPAGPTIALRAPGDPESTVVMRDELVASSAVSAALTQHGTIVGTIRYMSPEQASGEELGEPSDMFSLGILLQELLTGRPAYEDVSIVELLRRVVRHETLPVEGVEPEVARLVEDLKHPVPARRPSAEATLERLRFILAKPQRLRRRRLLLGAAAAGFVLLAVVLVVVSVLAVRAERARARAEDLAGRLEQEAERANREATTANRVADFLVDLFEEADPEQAQGRDVTVREVVERGSDRIGRELAEEPLVQARLQTTLGAISWRLGDYGAAASLLERAVATVERERGVDDPAVAEVLAPLGAVYADQQRFEEASRVLVRARSLLESDAAPRVGDLARTLNSLGTVALREGRIGDAEELFSRSLELWRSAVRPAEREIAGSLNNLAILAWQRADYPAAEGYYRQALALEERRLGPEDPRLVAPLNNMGILLRDQGRFEEAERLHLRALAIAEKSLGATHPDVASVLSSLSRLYGRQERIAEGIPLLERALRIARSAYGPRHPETGTTLVRLGDFERRAGHLERAERLIGSGKEILVATLGASHPRLVEALTALGRLRVDQRRMQLAAASFREAERIGSASLGAEHPEVSAVREALASLQQPPPPIY